MFNERRMYTMLARCAAHTSQVKPPVITMKLQLQCSQFESAARYVESVISSQGVPIGGSP